MKDISILFPDSIHFHERNFKSLFELITRHSLSHTFIKDRNSWVAAYGQYSNFENELKDYYTEIKNFSSDQLSTITKHNINLFSICRDEALTFYLPNPMFRDLIKDVPDNNKLLSIMYSVDSQALLLNLSAAWSWLDFWIEKLSSIKIHTYACIFSGAQIYNRALIEILKVHQTTPLVMEHFFTGNEYYIEEKYEPIPNNTNLRHNNTYKNIIIDNDPLEQERTRIKAINKILLANNKNVKQPDGDFIIENNGKKVVSIIGQVVNDFSIICTAKKYLSSIDFYIELINKLLKNDDIFVVFKAHPWERQKNNIKEALTFNCITKFVSGLSEEKASRVFITEDFNLSALIKQSDHIVTLCSQSAIEAAFLGSKPVQLGQAFYGKKGFTYDYDSIDNFIEQLNDNKLNRFLTIAEYKNLEIFLVRYLEKHLVSVHKSGILSLERKLKKRPLIPLIKAIDKQIINSQKIIITVPPYKILKSKNKFRKFRRNPKRFFLDSRFKLLNIVGKFF